MGDRTNIVVTDGPDHRVYLYGHWSGGKYILNGAAALKKAIADRRETDPQYLARIVFDEMVGNHRGGTTGFGITARIHDNEYPVLVLGDNATVWFESEDDLGGKPVAGPWPAAEFIAHVEAGRIREGHLDPTAPEPPEDE